LEKGEERDLAIINVYVPRAADDEERWAYKQRFLALLQSRAESLLRNGRYNSQLFDFSLLATR
jgi:exonuclease III